MVLLESLSSVEYGIEKDFLFFAFYRELSRFKVLIKRDDIPLFLLIAAQR